MGRMAGGGRGSRAAALALGLAATGLPAMGLPSGAVAHPHVWIDARSQVLFDAQQRMTALRVSWRFDEVYSLLAIEGLDRDGDGALTPEELKPLAEVNVTSLEEYRYFTEILADGKALAYGKVTDYGSRYEEGILTLEFTIPLEAPVDPRRAEVAFKSYDPTFYIAIEPALQEPVSFAGTPPPSCSPAVQEGEAPEALNLSEADFLDPAASASIGALYATTIAIVCDPAGAKQ
jgi:ABC-type uncharacterized transport system substrate-binding protein